MKNDSLGTICDAHVSVECGNNVAYFILGSTS